MKYFLTIVAFMVCSAIQAQWYQVNSNTAENLHDIFFVDSLTGYCVGGGDEYGFNNNGNGVVLKTTDGGENWTTVFSQDSLSIQHVAIINENNYTKLYGFAMKNGTPYLLSTFLFTQFQNWTIEETIYSPSDVQVYNNVIYFRDASDGTLKELQNNQINAVLPDVSIFHVNNEGIAFLTDNVDSVYASTISGNSIMYSNILPQEMGSNQILEARIAAFNDTVVIKGTYPNLVTRSFNQGAEWETHVSGPGIENIILSSSLQFGIDNLDRIQVTQNAGETWQIQDSLGVRINRLYFYNELMGFAVGEDGSIFKTTNGGGITSTSEIDDLKKKIEIFPNPTRDIINIKTPKALNVIDIRLTNISGKLIDQYLGKQRVIEISSLPKGTYFLLLETNKGSITRKIVLDN